MFYCNFYFTSFYFILLIFQLFYVYYFLGIDVRRWLRSQRNDTHDEAVENNDEAVENNGEAVENSVRDEAVESNIDQLSESLFTGVDIPALYNALYIGCDIIIRVVYAVNFYF